MSNISDSYWLRINSNTFVWCKGDNGILYDAKQMRIFEFVNRGVIKRICAELSVIDNLYCVPICDKEFKDVQFKSWVDQIISGKFGLILKKQDGELKPISLPPLLNIQQDIRRFAKSPSHFGGKDLLKYLHEIIFYINGDNIDDNHYYKQFIHPQYSQETLQIDKIEKFINSLGVAKPGVVHIVGGIFQYPYLERLMNFIHVSNIHCYYYTTCYHILKGMMPVFFNQPYITLKILISLTANIDEDIIKAISVLSGFCGNLEWVFIVESEDDCIKIDELSELFSLSNVTFKAFFNGKNHAFFEHYILLSIEDRQNLNVTKNDVFAHQVLNSYNFGLITFMPDGTAYSNPNFSSIGSIETPPLELIFKELTEGSSWLRLRNMEPCISCPYQFLCPSPSNYEIAMERQNLCNIY